MAVPFTHKKTFLELSDNEILDLRNVNRFIGVEILEPGSYHGIPVDMLLGEKSRELMNFSYITLLTVGYGDISPVSFAAQKLAVLTAMLGQFYLVIITAVVMGKFLQKKENG